MKLIADYHTHSKNSRFFHAKNSILEMAISANEMGLNEIAITDHGFKHLCGINKAKLMKAREEIDEINTWSKTKVLLGIEADIISEDGTIDVDNESLAMLDLLVVGYHKMVKTDFAGYFGNVAKSEESKVRCTNAFVNCINRYPVTMVSHLDSVLETDLYRIGCACRDKNVLVEINNRHTKWTREQVDELVASDCLFAVCSDAHRREDVGHVDRAFRIIKKHEIPTENIVNVEFAEDEKTEDHREADYYYSIYQSKKQEKLNKEIEKEEKKRVEFTESLSPEMEKALREIAKEKGIVYVNREEPSEEDESDFVSSFNFVDDTDIIERAKNYIEQNKLKEFERQNEFLDEEKANLNENSSNAQNERPVVENNQNDSDIRPVENTEFVQPKKPNNFVSGQILELEKEDEKKEVLQNNQNNLATGVQTAVQMGAIGNKKAYPTTQKLDIVRNEPKAVNSKKSSFNPLGAVLGEIDSSENKTQIKEENTEQKPEPIKKKRTAGFMSSGIIGTAEDHKNNK